jgi:hypothetical protein
LPIGDVSYGVRDSGNRKPGARQLFPPAAHLNKVIRIPAAVFQNVVSACAAVPLGCTGSASLGTFQLTVRPFSQGAPLPLKSVAAIPGGARLIWTPVHLMAQNIGNAEVTAVLVPDGGGKLLTLEPRKAATSTEWQLPERPQVIALIYGPQGLSEGKINNLITHNQELLRELADYAEESSQVESVVQQLADAEAAGGGTDAVLKGISAQYGSGVTRLDPKATSDQQAASLLRAILPASSAYDPLAARSGQTQTGGLAANMAGLFFGDPVGLAVGGAALLQNLRTVMFPGTDFRSAFAQTAPKEGLALCTKNLAAKSKNRSAYLWAYRVPQLKKPAPALEGSQHLPIGSKSTVKLAGAAVDLSRAREWHLSPSGGGGAIPVDVQPSNGALQIDLAKAKPAAGDYQLVATWDWDPMPVSGTLHLHPYADFAHVALARGEQDKLVEGRGSVDVQLTGADFQFLETAAVESSAKAAKPADVPFTLPSGKRGGPQDSVTVTIDTAKRGAYRLLLAQSDGAAHRVDMTVLPPDPKLTSLPIRVNQGEAHQAIRLQGSGLERIEAVTSDAGDIQGKPDAQGWAGEVSLKAGLTPGTRLPLQLKVQGLERPLTVQDAVEVVGPRPAIQGVQRSQTSALGIAVAADELPAGTAAGLALRVDHLTERGRPRLELGCASGEQRQKLTVGPGEPAGGATLTAAGPGALYLSVDPGAVGFAGCRLTAVVILDPEGRSDPYVLGRVVRVPRLEKFTLTSEKVGDSSYVGSIEGRDLDVIEKTGWDSQHGTPVEAIPTPIPGADPARQTLRVVLPWPAPAPHAPLYVWLRGETEGRKAEVVY